jgi:hypothetical protein
MFLIKRTFSKPQSPTASFRSNTVHYFLCIHPYDNLPILVHPSSNSCIYPFLRKSIYILTSVHSLNQSLVNYCTHESIRPPIHHRIQYYIHSFAHKSTHNSTLAHIHSPNNLSISPLLRHPFARQSNHWNFINSFGYLNILESVHLSTNVFSNLVTKGNFFTK